MDDSRLFISSQTQVTARVYDDGHILWLRKYQSSRDLSRPRTKVTTPYPTPFLPTNDAATCTSQYPPPSCFRCLHSDKTQQPRSQWHRALEILEEKRKWRNAAAELSEVFGRWLARWRAKGGQDIVDHSQGIIYDNLGKEQPSISPVPVGYSEAKALTIIQQSVIEICEESDDTDEVVLIECGDNIPTLRVNDEKAYRSGTNRSRASLLKNEQTSPGSFVRVEETTTPGRSPSSSSSPAASPRTPTSHRSHGLFEDTPDTPESVLRPSQRSSGTSDPESPTSKRLRSSDYSSASLKAPTSFEYPPLPDNIFSEPNLGYDQDYGLRPRHRRSPSSQRSSGSQNKDTRRTTRSQALASSAQVEAPSTPSPLSGGGVKAKRLTSKGEAVSTKLADVTVKHEEEHKSSPPSNQAAGHILHVIKNEIQETPADINALLSLSLQPAEEETIEEVRISSAPPRFANALQVYDAVTNTSTRKNFETDVERCFANNKKGKRCNLRQKNRSKESIRHAIESLEAITHENSFEGYQKGIEALVNLSVCGVRGSFKGHTAKLNEIILDFQNVVASSLSLGTRTLVLGLKTTVDSASSYSHTITATKQVIYSTPNLFIGLKQWQPARLIGKDVSRCLQELAKRPLTSIGEAHSGYIYAYRIEGLFGFVKIGHTGDTIDARLKQWKSKCKHEPKSIFGNPSLVPHISRVEKLIHMELKEYRHKQTQCKCGKGHREWFAVSHDIAKVVVAKWSGWMNNEPYDGEGVLKTELLKRLHEVCKPTHLLLATEGGTMALSKLVKGLEQTFEFRL